MTADEVPDVIRFGRVLKKLKGLWFIGIGFCILVIWFCPLYFIEDQFGFQYPKTASSVVKATLHDIPDTFLQTPWSFVAIVAFIVIGIGIYRLVRSLQESRR